jgi:hypothetical protein
VSDGRTRRGEMKARLLVHIAVVEAEKVTISYDVIHAHLLLRVARSARCAFR